MLILLAVFGTARRGRPAARHRGARAADRFAVISLLAGVTEMSIFVTNVATMIGLALSIDYSLFTVSRFREELRHRSVADRRRADDGHASARRSRSSGVAVAIGLSRA